MIWRTIFSIRTIQNSSTYKEETIVSAHVVTIVGDQASTKGTPKNKRKIGQEKLFLPSFAQNDYSLDHLLIAVGLRPHISTIEITIHLIQRMV